MPSHLERRALKEKEVFKRDRDREILISRMGHSMVRNMKTAASSFWNGKCTVYRKLSADLEKREDRTLRIQGTSMKTSS